MVCDKLDRRRKSVYRDIGNVPSDPDLNRVIREKYFGEKPSGLELTRENFISSYEFLGADPEEHIEEKRGLLGRLEEGVDKMDAETISQRLGEIYASAIKGNWEY